MEDRARKQPAERFIQLLTPLDREAVLSQCLVLGLELGSLVRVCGQAQAAGPPEGVARQLGKPIEVVLRQPPERLGSVVPEFLPCDVVGWSATAESEASVTPARAACDFARLVDANAQPRLCEHTRARATGDAAAHDGHVDPSLASARRRR